MAPSEPGQSAVRQVKARPADRRSGGRSPRIGICFARLRTPRPPLRMRARSTGEIGVLTVVVAATQATVAPAKPATRAAMHPPKSSRRRNANRTTVAERPQPEQQNREESWDAHLGDQEIELVLRVQPRRTTPEIRSQGPTSRSRPRTGSSRGSWARARATHRGFGRTPSPISRCSARRSPRSCSRS